MFEKLGEVMLTVFDELNNDIDCQKLIDNMDAAGSDTDLLKYIKQGIDKIEEKGNKKLADKLKNDINCL